MPKVDPRNKVGAIVHTVSNRVLSNHTAKNIYGNVNYAKTFLQGTIMNVFEGHAPGSYSRTTPNRAYTKCVHAEEILRGVTVDPIPS